MEIDKPVKIFVGFVLFFLFILLSVQVPTTYNPYGLVSAIIIFLAILILVVSFFL